MLPWSLPEVLALVLVENTIPHLHLPIVLFIFPTLPHLLIREDRQRLWEVVDQMDLSVLKT
jgi:hypothetical protein